MWGSPTKSFLFLVVFDFKLSNLLNEELKFVYFVVREKTNQSARYYVVVAVKYFEAEFMRFYYSVITQKTKVVFTL